MIGNDRLQLSRITIENHRRRGTPKTLSKKKIGPKGSHRLRSVERINLM
jgi:hypothetical protein